MVRKVFTLVALFLLLVACSGEMTAEDYSLRAGELMASGQRSAAMELLREGVYTYPENYKINLLMGRLLHTMWMGARAESRGLYLARHYLRRAETLAPDAGRAAEARAAYQSVRKLQRIR